jgi:hypothetical protein
VFMYLVQLIFCQPIKHKMKYLFGIIYMINDESINTFSVAMLTVRIFTPNEQTPKQLQNLPLIGVVPVLHRRRGSSARRA